MMIDALKIYALGSPAGKTDLQDVQNESLQTGDYSEIPNNSKNDLLA